MLKLITPFILVAALAVTLLNGNAFGSPTLVSLFLFSLLTCIAGMILFLTLVFRKRTKLPKPPLPLWLFLSLVIYVLADGLLHEFNLTHLLWAAYGLWSLVIYFWATLMVSERRTSPAIVLYRVVLFLALTESVIVLLQTARLFPVPSQWFIATGTWVNPNVTAIFIALSLFAVLRLKEASSAIMQHFFYWPVLILMMLATALLQCRSAWLAAVVIWLAEYRHSLFETVRRNFRFSWKGGLLLIGLLMVLQAFYVLYSTKEASARNRLSIWKNSLQMIAGKPLTGYGFGMFEKEYNLFSASARMPVNDHVNMAYNDFLELGVEGGIPAIMLYIFFLMAWWQACRKNPGSAVFFSIIIALLVVQLTNFVFQAVPAMALVLMYAAVTPIVLPVPQPEQSLSKKKKKVAVLSAPSPVYTKWWIRSLTGITGLLLSFLLFLQASLVTSGFYNKTLIVDSDAVPAAKLERLNELYFKLHASPSFYEVRADLYMAVQQPEDALGLYLSALERSSEPDLLSKTGYCYQLLSGYDSSRFYYETACHLQPHRFTPKLRLMQLYAEKMDTVSMLQTAGIILKMPVKVSSKKVTDIQQLAKSVIGIYDKHPGLSAPF
ncbi:MAG: O-antigen ligase family protein [Pseudobacter sp.]|uniref:O-antigen ligase family protein n=1 Tax=Pseudobacter sp. TaxID=2045420 RepID=UPI003F81786F